MRPPALGRAPTSLSLSAQTLVQKHPHGPPRTVLKQTSGSRGPVSRTHEPSRLAPAGDTTVTQISIVIAVNYSTCGCGPTLRVRRWPEALGLTDTPPLSPQTWDAGAPGGSTRSGPPHQAPGLCSEPHAAPLRQAWRLRLGRLTSLGPHFRSRLRSQLRPGTQRPSLSSASHKPVP